jgi:hypothetical protein
MLIHADPDLKYRMAASVDLVYDMFVSTKQQYENSIKQIFSQKTYVKKCT